MYRRDLISLLTTEPRSVSSIAAELGLRRNDVEEDLQHAIRSARAAGYRVLIQPAECRACGFTFAGDRLRKPGKCPACKMSRIFEAQIFIQQE
jgi:predicted Zn-ribbon and HTH transcriptional regulator